MITTQQLGAGPRGDEGSPQQPGALAAAAGAVKAAPAAVRELDAQLLLPAVRAFADGVAAVTSDTTEQVDLVLSRLASCCRRADPELLPSLRGELLYLARIVEQPVRAAVQLGRGLAGGEDVLLCHQLLHFYY